MNFDVYGASDIGRVRNLNEDSFCIHGFDTQADASFCILSDGMGGHNAGEIASQRSVQFAAEILLKKTDTIPQQLNLAVETANEKICRMAQENQGQYGMGATLVLAKVGGDTVYIANVGDSRAYALRGGTLLQITKDHSVVEEMVANGTLSKEEARNHPQRNIITRAIGANGEARADIFEYEYFPKDQLLLCSDGLSSMLEDEEIKRIMMESQDAKQTVTALIDAANERGGKDNITVICIRFI